jgi:hypothetical protein
MRIRSIIVFLGSGVQIIDEYLGKYKPGLSIPNRDYVYKYMTPASYNRLVKLSDRPQATIRLVPWGKLKDMNVVIYWKRE